MDIKFIVDDFVLIWNLLFQASISDSIYKLKQKLWLNYKNEYNDLYKEKNFILEEGKNYIPNDDTIFNIMLESKDYQKIKTEVEKYRLQIINLWTKKVFKNLQDILKVDIPNYKVYLIDDQLDVIDSSSKKESNAIIFGKKIPTDNPNKIVLDIASVILQREIHPKEEQDNIIINAIIEMAIYNELATRLNGKSCYFTGAQYLTPIKRQLYPYWLMYLGIGKSDMPKYMARDKIAFDTEKFKLDEKLKDLDLFEFINFCLQNKKYLVEEEKIEII